ncbi:hypothetical protein WN51_02602 [Melipona quadrifasciata]|uniref:Uncharacterized protein n=1 Tax=Melipona quadrifasciata TaxID=166423 RepID=A0A0M8ZUZ7_9HYME|nr:hypothetical protein WN51_02602 [Melipona quadrifasciata]
MKSPGITLSSKGGDPGRNEPHPEQGEAVTIFHLLRFTAVNGHQLYPANKDYGICRMQREEKKYVNKAGFGRGSLEELELLEILDLSLVVLDSLGISAIAWIIL